MSFFQWDSTFHKWIDINWNHIFSIRSDCIPACNRILSMNTPNVYKWNMHTNRETLALFPYIIVFVLAVCTRWFSEIEFKCWARATQKTLAICWVYVFKSMASFQQLNLMIIATAIIAQNDQHTFNIFK